jgi:hypothetical protein
MIGCMHNRELHLPLSRNIARDLYPSKKQVPERHALKCERRNDDERAAT